MKRLQLDRLSHERKQDMSNLIRCWKSSGLSLSVLEENLAILAKDKRPKADDVLKGKYRAEPALFATFSRGSAPARTRAMVTRGDAELIMEIITELKKEVPGLGDSPEDARILLEGVASVLFTGTAAEGVPARLQETLRRALLRLDPRTGQGSLF